MSAELPTREAMRQRIADLWHAPNCPWTVLTALCAVYGVVAAEEERAEACEPQEERANTPAGREHVHMFKSADFGTKCDGCALTYGEYVNGIEEPKAPVPVPSPASPEERCEHEWTDWGGGVDHCVKCEQSRTTPEPKATIDAIRRVALFVLHEAPNRPNLTPGLRTAAETAKAWADAAPRPAPPVGEWTDEEATSEIAEATANEVQAGQEVLYEVDGLAPRWMPVAKIAQSDSSCWDLVFHWEETGSMPVRLSSTVVVRRPALRPNRPEIGAPKDDEWTVAGGARLRVEAALPSYSVLDFPRANTMATLNAADRARLVAALGGGGGKPELTDEMVERAAIVAWEYEGRVTLPWVDAGKGSHDLFLGRARAALLSTGAFSTPSGVGEGR